MQTHFFQGNNLSKINWEYFLTIHQYHAYSYSNWESYLNELLYNTPMNQMLWSIESNGKHSNGNHAHILLEGNGIITEDSLIDYFLSVMRNGKELPYSKTMFNTSSDLDKYCLSFDKNTNRMNRLIEYKDVQRLVDINGNIITRNVFKKIFIPFRHLNGKDNRVYIESVKGVKNASIYTSKFTSQKISTGYLKKVS